MSEAPRLPADYSGFLFCGDNLGLLPSYLPDESVDLVYLDPPFTLDRRYNSQCAQMCDAEDARLLAFARSWRWDDPVRRQLESLVAEGGTVSSALHGLHAVLGPSDLMAYLTMLAPRLRELRRVLRPIGSVYVHCNPGASHYLKILMDAVFGPSQFRSEIVWKRSTAHSDTRQGRRTHGRVHDVILFYTASDEWIWNPSYTQHNAAYLRKKYRHVEPGTGRRYRLDNLTGPGGAVRGNPRYEVMGVTRHWRFSQARMQQLMAEGRIVQTRPGRVPQYKRYLDETSGVPLQDVWTDIDVLNSRARERLGYQTQKPEALLERIIRSSCPPDGLVLDPFCACGTTLVVAERLGRRWIGMDNTYEAIEVVRARFRSQFRIEVTKVVGTPVRPGEAMALRQAAVPDLERQGA